MKNSPLFALTLMPAILLAGCGGSPETSPAQAQTSQSAAVSPQQAAPPATQEADTAAADAAMEPAQGLAKQAPAKQAPATAGIPTAPQSAVTPVATLPLAIVHKSPSCGCCRLWVDHLRAAGFRVEVRDHDNVNPVKERLGVPYGKGSCHTAQIGGYFVEGHVPAQDIKRLLAEKPDAKGLVVPGMPLGSPGMEVPEGTVDAYTVELVRPDGSTVAFARHGD